MTKFLISFPAPAMNVPKKDLADVSEAAHAVIREAKSAGAYVFGGGINEGVLPLLVAADGTVTKTEGVAAAVRLSLPIGPPVRSHRCASRAPRRH